MVRFIALSVALLMFFIETPVSASFVPPDTMILLTAPISGASFQTGESLTIRWASLYKSKNEYMNGNYPIRLELYSPNRGTIKIVDSLKDIGSYSWKIPDSLNYDSAYSINIYATGLPYGYHSTEKFTINCPKQFIMRSCKNDTTVFTEIFAHHHSSIDYLHINFIVKGAIPKGYDIFYKSIDSSKWITLVENTTYPNYTWTIPDSLNGDYKLRVITHNDTFATESGIISILPMPLRIELPYTVYSAQPVFTWHPVKGISAYIFDLVDFDTYQTSTILDTVSDTTYIPSINLEDGEYSWRVRPLTAKYEAFENLKEGSIFRVDLMTPQTIAPDQIVTRDRRPVFRWHPLLQNTNIQNSFTVHISLDAAFTTVIKTSKTPDTSFQNSDDLPIDTIYWKVISDQSGRSSIIRKLIIAPDTIPLLKTVENKDAILERTVLAWEPVENANTYKIEIFKQITTLSKRADLVEVLPNLTLIHSEITSDTFYTPPKNLQTGSYEWRVSSDRDDFAAFSYPETFTVSAETKTQFRHENEIGKSSLLFKNNRPTVVLPPSNNNTRITIFSINGKKLAFRQLPASNQTRHIRISDFSLTSGVYIINILNGHTSISENFKYN